MFLKGVEVKIENGVQERYFLCTDFAGSLTAFLPCCRAGEWMIYLGAQDLNANEDGRVTVTTRNGIVHSGYSSQTLNNDVALLNLGSAVSLSSKSPSLSLCLSLTRLCWPSSSFVSCADFIQTVNLASSNTGDLNGSGVTVSGWGKTSDCKCRCLPALVYFSSSFVRCRICGGQESYVCVTVEQPAAPSAPRWITLVWPSSPTASVPATTEASSCRPPSAAREPPVAAPATWVPPQSPTPTPFYGASSFFFSTTSFLSLPLSNVDGLIDDSFRWPRLFVVVAGWQRRSSGGGQRRLHPGGSRELRVQRRMRQRCSFGIRQSLLLQILDPVQLWSLESASWTDFGSLTQPRSMVEKIINK